MVPKHQAAMVQPQILMKQITRAWLTSPCNNPRLPIRKKNISPTYPPSHPHCISRKWLVYPWLSPQKVVGLPIFSGWNRHFHEMITWSCLKPHEASIQSPWIGPFNGHFGWNRLMGPSPPSSPRCCDLGSSIDGIGRHGSAHRCAIRFSVPVGWAAKNAAGSLLGTPFWGWTQCFHRWPLWRNETSKSPSETLNSPLSHPYGFVWR